MKRVVITGVGMISAVGNDVKTSWKKTLAGESGIASIEGHDLEDMAVTIAGQVKDFDPTQTMDPKEVRRSSRFVQFAVHASKEAIEDSGYDCENEAESIGCCIGVGIGGIDMTEENSIILKERGPKRISPFFLPYIIPNMAAGVVAKNYNLKGPNICPTTACTSGTHGIGEGYLYIKNGMTTAMVAGGSEAALCRLSLTSFANMKALSTNNENPSEASRPFDQNRDGFVMGEGAGIVILEELEHAKARGAKIYAEVIGYGMSGDAHHITSPAPEGEGGARSMQMAVDTGNIPLDQVDYINAHGTSTSMNDKFETMAIKTVFGDHAKDIAISSTKGVTGHCLGAAGGIEGVFTALAISEGQIPPTANLKTLDPECDLDYVPGKARNKTIRYALSNSFGFGGTNATIAMKQFNA